MTGEGELAKDGAKKAARPVATVYARNICMDEAEEVEVASESLFMTEPKCANVRVWA